MRTKAEIEATIDDAMDEVDGLGIEMSDDDDAALVAFYQGIVERCRMAIKVVKSRATEDEPDDDEE